MKVLHWMLRARGLVYATGFVLIWGWLALRAQRLDSLLGGPLPEPLRALGIAMAPLGALLAAACVSLFMGPGKGTPAPFDPPREFVAVGPYRWVRNPMYVGGFGVLLGAGLWLRSPGILVLGAGFALASHMFVVLVEEPGLKARFGDPYQRYLTEVSPWLPRKPREPR